MTDLMHDDMPEQDGRIGRCCARVALDPLMERINDSAGRCRADHCEAHNISPIDHMTLASDPTAPITVVVNWTAGLEN